MSRKRSWDFDQRILYLYILPYLGEKCMRQIHKKDIISWQGTLRGRGLAPSSCNRAFVLLKTIFNHALVLGAVPQGHTPFLGVPMFEDKIRRERYLTAEEARRLLVALERSQQTSAKVIQLLLYTGARRCEILKARWEHVHYESRLLTVPLSKSGRTRHIPLSDAAILVLRSIQGKSDWVFPRRDGEGPLGSVFKYWSRLRKQLGLEDVRLHDLRHSFASFMVNSGCSLYEVQQCLGHYDPKVTMRYAHLASESLVQAANKVSRAVQGETRN